jgi:sterol-4alpha-carboxylate 3-dehydrogenase (decarboxylating)
VICLTIPRFQTVPHQLSFPLFTITATMAPIPSEKKKPIGNVLIIGGCGFLGHHIVNLLHSSYSSTISVIDLHTNRNRRPDSDGVKYFDGDITNLSSLIPIFESIKPDVVIHTASPNLMGASNALYQKVNVEGTKCVIEACQKTNVKALVYTSSASIISDNASDLINADERWPVIPPKAQTEYYSTTKVRSSLPLHTLLPICPLHTSTKPTTDMFPTHRQKPKL